MRESYDLFVIGGGINGCGIARDASGRGLSVGLAEMGDLAGATSSASTKLFHGGLRYLEYWEVRLVREALQERDVLLRNMPHISWPMRFVLPLSPEMRFEGGTPTSKLLGTVMPWLKGRRPDWLIRTGLLMYDTLGKSKIMPGTATISLDGTPEGGPLEDRFHKAFEYSDAWVEDSRLVVLNARDAAARGAEIHVRTRVVSAVREGDEWLVTLEGERSGQVRAKMLVNAAGPWVGSVIHGVVRSNAREGVRLVRGSHVITKRLWDHDKCYFFQGEDGRIIFAIPYEYDYTLIGTTDAEHEDPDKRPTCTPEERDYLIAFANRYLKADITTDDVVHTYSGVRPLYDDGAKSATAATRDYVLKVEDSGAPVLNVFGGKITTYRRLAEHAVEKIGQHLKLTGGGWTHYVPLPGGDFPVDGQHGQATALKAAYPFLTDHWAIRLVRAYGTQAPEVLGAAKTAADLGEDFGATLTAAEVAWQMDEEWARKAEDVAWRRTKLGLRLDEAQMSRLDAWMADRRASSQAAE
ncbi:glycerol-3-phosphate dehydrogenase [Jannaschia aquimarina]|uniref:Glycerol-3-phosphate dehydrogenase n=1 Tax=Jannaschia aquimarina TaxID=935700 RepID=A0A0D1CTD1_9RHOB|nr:glycerol-3-phosphate dehydrogenase [Jannaschia aquimarina]KIT18027.1 Aerobic glycerol-3-phosphate dehydrogenase [Jannaschia aquimarina]SNS88821.1 homodimeric glycerol 3-phosphate dehydrogenase (quinone) [Jannaschia aquimarina]